MSQSSSIRRFMLSLVGFALCGSALAQSIEHIGTPRLNEKAALSLTVRSTPAATPGQETARSAMTRSLTVQSNIAGASRFLVPTAWTGFAQQGVDTSRRSSASLTQGETWVGALERWLAQENLTARLDWNTNRFYLDAGRVAVAQPASPLTNAVAAAPSQAVSALPTSQSVALTPPVPVPVPPQSWEIDLKDIHLGNTFARWGKKMGWTVLWDAPKHIMIEATSVFTGSLPEAIDQVLRSPGISTGAFPLEACVYPNTPPLVRITLKGEQSNECK